MDQLWGWDARRLGSPAARWSLGEGTAQTWGLRSEPWGYAQRLALGNPQTAKEVAGKPSNWWIFHCHDCFPLLSFFSCCRKPRASPPSLYGVTCEFSLRPIVVLRVSRGTLYLIFWSSRRKDGRKSSGAVGFSRKMLVNQKISAWLRKTGRLLYHLKSYIYI